MKVRVGIDRRRAYADKARELGAPVMISANALRSRSQEGWHVPDHLGDLDIALDSGGFVAAMNGGFTFSQEEYLDLVEIIQPNWYAAMDFCCEPEIAEDRQEVHRRILRTVDNLRSLLPMAQNRRLPPPVPVIQGWTPDEYEDCMERFSELYPDGWPPLMGVGSVCRRPVGGETGLFNVLNRISDALGSAETKLHLFGVKGPALVKLRQLYSDRVESTDSFAHAKQAQWDRWKAKRLGLEPVSRIEQMERWYRRNAWGERGLWRD